MLVWINGCHQLAYCAAKYFVHKNKFGQLLFLSLSLSVLVSVSVHFITLKFCVGRSDAPEYDFATVNVNPKPVN